MILYGVVEKKDEVCEYGGKHSVQYCTTKIVDLTDETWLCNNGYERSQQPIYIDYQGRKYKKFVSIDYTGNVWYIRDDGSHWYPRLPYNGKVIDAINR